MKVHRLEPDGNRFQSFLIDEDESSDRELEFNGEAFGDSWDPPPVYIREPKKKKGDFFGFQHPGAFVVSERVGDDLRDLLEQCCELLPIQYKGEAYYIVNVISCFDVLDQGRTEWHVDPETGSKFEIARHAFHAHRLGGDALFKIPETCCDILTVEGLQGPEDEFKSRVEGLGYSGLRYVELWSNDK